MVSAGWAPPNPSREPEGLSDWLTSLGVAVAILATALGLLVGLVAPSRPPTVSAGDVDESTIMAQLWRRAFVAAVVGGAAIGAFTGGLVSVTTDVSRDDPPSNSGSAGGLLYGAVLGVALGVGGGFLIGVAGLFLVLFRSRRVTLMCAAASAMLVSALFASLLIMTAGSGLRQELPGSVPSVIVLASSLGALASTPYLIGWYLRLCTASRVPA